MVTLRARSGAPELLRHSVELTNLDLDGLLETLDTKSQNLFWTEVRIT